MTKKDYVLIADALYTAGSNLKETFTLEEVAVIAREYEKQVARFLALDNSRFDVYKFSQYINGIGR